MSGDLMAMTWKYGARGPVGEEVMAEVRRTHAARNKRTEIEIAYQAAVAAAWEEDPEVAPVLARLAAAEEAAAAAKAAYKTARSRLGWAKQTGNRARVTAAQAAARLARQAHQDADALRKDAKQALRVVKGLRYPAAQARFAAAKAARDEAVRDAKAAAAAGGLFWANWGDVDAQHNARVRRIATARRQRRPAALRYKRWDGTGTVAVQVQRELGVTAETRELVARMRAQGATAPEIGAAAGIAPRTVTRMRDDGKPTQGEPPCTPAVLASGDGKWRKLVQLAPELPAGFAARPRAERRRIARTGMLGIRTGATAQWSEIPVTIHRPMPAAADVKLARLTVTRCGPDQRAHVTFAARVAAPAPRRGRTAVVHAGWRALPDGCLRVAVISGHGPVPAGMPPVVRDHGAWAEVVIPATWRDDQARTEKIASRRGLAFERARGDAAAWLEGRAAEGLPAAAQVRAWRSPGRLVAFGRDCAAGACGPAAVELGEEIGAWARADEPQWRTEARSRARLARRRRDAWRCVASWLARDPGIGEVRVDEWDAAPLARRPRTGEEEGDGPQEAAARANRVLAAPGELRAAVAWACAREGVRVTEPALDGPQPCAACGAPLDGDARREAIVVRCECGALVDQDVNMLGVLGMLAEGEDGSWRMPG